MAENDTRIQRIAFGILLFAVTAAFLWLIRGFLQPVFWAIALGVLFVPVNRFFIDKTKGRESLAATLTLIVILLIAILPLTGIVVAVAAEAAQLYDAVRNGRIDIASTINYITTSLPLVTESLDSIGFDAEKLKSQLSTLALQFSQFMTSLLVAIGQNTMRVTVMFFLMLYLLFFVIRDGSKMLSAIVHALPLGDDRERALVSRFAQVSRATIKGTVVIGIVQGTIGALTFMFLGISSPVLWGVVMALLSMVPAVGPALVWIPAAIMLFADGRTGAGITLIIVGVIIIGLADNLLRPVLVGRDTSMPDYLILLSTLGGLVAFGLAGVVIGPIIAAFFLTVWEMAIEEFGHRDL